MTLEEWMEPYNPIIRRMADYQRKMIRQKLCKVPSCAECGDIRCLSRIETVILQVEEAKNYAEAAMKVAAGVKR